MCRFISFCGVTAENPTAYEGPTDWFVARAMRLASITALSVSVKRKVKALTVKQGILKQIL